MTEQELKRAIEKAEGEERVDLLLQLANLARSYDPKKAVALAEDALALSIECALPDKQIQSHICLCDAQFTGGDFNGWRRSITDARALLKQHPDDALDFHLEILETRQLYMEGTIDVALERFLILDSRLEPLELTSNDWLRNFIRVKVYLGHCWLKINNPVAALDCYYGLDEIVQANDPQGSNPALNWQKQEV